MWSAQNAAFDHIFDHLQTRTTWKQCFEEHTKAPFLDTKAPKITRNYTKNLCSCVRLSSWCIVYNMFMFTIVDIA